MQGKVIIVTGAAAGLGAAQAQLLGQAGVSVVVADIDVHHGNGVAAAVDGALFVEHDSGEPDSWTHLIEATLARFGRIDGLVNNAGIIRFATIEDCSIEDYRLHQRVMSEGTFLGCRAVIPVMAEKGGAIVNIASVTALRGSAQVPAYAAAKGAILSLGRSIIVHCQDKGYPIRLNTVLPGSHATAMAHAARAVLTPEQKLRIDATQGAPRDVAELILFLMSDASATINGAEIVIDNGRTVR